MITESNLRIDGEIKGNVSSSAKIVVGSTGIVHGNIICADADIEGKVVGTIKVEALLVLRSTSNIEGEINTSKIQIDEGAEFSGECRMRNGSKNGHVIEKVKNSEKELVY